MHISYSVWVTVTKYATVTTGNHRKHHSSYNHKKRKHNVLFLTLNDASFARHPSHVNGGDKRETRGNFPFVPPIHVQYVCQLRGHTQDIRIAHIWLGRWAINIIYYGMKRRFSNLFPVCVRPIMQMRAVLFACCAPQALAYFITRSPSRGTYCTDALQVRLPLL